MTEAVTTPGDTAIFPPYLFGINPCIEGGTFFPTKPLSYFCPVACGASSPCRVRTQRGGTLAWDVRLRTSNPAEMYVQADACCCKQTALDASSHVKRTAPGCYALRWD